MVEIPKKGPNETYTPQQWQAIYDGEDNLLVSASAGSGKTTVLVQRVIEKLKNGTNIDELLIVTYTEAAAREMKERIQQALQEASRTATKESDRQHFTRQLLLLPTASISTLHAFCLTVIRRFYYLIDLDPVFRMLTDETETLLLKEDVWEELREQLYAKDEALFYQLTTNFSNDRNDNGLTDMVFSLYEFARANPDPKEWLHSLADNYRVEEGVEHSALYQNYLRPQIINQLTATINSYEKMVEVAQVTGLEKVHALVSDEKESLEGFLLAVQNNQLDEAYRYVESLVFERYPSIRKEELKPYSVEVKGYRDKAKKGIENLIKSFFSVSPDKMKELMTQSLPLVELMGEVTALFMTSYHQRKLEKGVLDFNDLEHFTLQILATVTDGVWQATEASDYYRKKFKEVMVDEYQDVNRLQENLLYWLREPDDTKGNMFMVGDVKQSIYSFRLADPTLFIEKYTAFKDEQGGRRIILAENFRSRSEVLDFTNLVFEQLMDEEVGQIEYDQAAKLVYGFPVFPESQTFKPELLIYEKEQEITEESLLPTEFIEDKTEGELYVTGLKIRKLIDSEFMIYDKKAKENRPVTYKDIVLLTPTKKNNLAILDVFKTLAIPVEVNDAQNYFQATEIRIMISLLQIIDNPFQDIPLVAVLRSPIVGLLEDELAKIRLVDKKNSFYEAVCLYEEHKTDELSHKLSNFLNQLSSWRELARREPLATLLWTIYDETAYLDYVAGLPVGSQRQANLIALVDRAKAYEQSSFRGLYQFVRFIEKMQEKDKDLAEPLTITEENAVRVMTIHASKGLEFPVVFLLDMSKQFNLQDVKARYMFEENIGAGIRYLTPDTRVLYDTLPYQAIKQVKTIKLLSEEMRKLYVGLTRAEQKLYLVGSYKNKADTLKAWSEAYEQQELVLDAASRIKSQGSLLTWIGMTLMRHPAMKQYDENYQPYVPLQEHPGDFSIDWITPAQIAEKMQNYSQKPLEKGQENQVELAKGDLQKVAQRLDYRYEYDAATQTTSYQSVSEIKRLFEDPDENQTAKLTWESHEEKALNQRFRYTEETLAKPKFLNQEQVITGAAIGTATHYILQLLPIDRVPSEKDIEELIMELVQKRLIAEEIAKRIDRKTILWFYQTILADELIANSALVKREQPFSTLVPADEIFTDYPTNQDDLLIHGIIDGYLEKEDEIILYDFKTDTVSKNNQQQEINEISQRYLGQLRLYQKSLSDALNKPVTKVYLILLAIQEVVDVTEKL
ncbi:helicase-exonuclease AddAB subunit AddA [Enterococcus sp. JM4C]|uniref:helicase-exonuclease AddAB subunit AddA n=1 Tax=Candidatus Enterococcus huntleyi TaxID=1857217 RepID=UPI00137A2231|nr:helicase-exonuclease AddAB subunit AddA [Enterococcus sp. JM4C]KAF1296585.1 helicase-exonuclease AddAB subunit AddA [Enterococcus sp. JM4C]